MQDTQHQTDFLQQKTSLSLKLFGIGFCLLLIIKLYLAVVLDLYSDEVFYWQASSHPALAYSDLPFMTALLIGLGSAADPGNTLAARSLFLVMGSCLPFLVYWIARPLTDRQQAIESAGLALCLPLGGFLGLLAVPDVPLLFFGLLSIGFFERALRRNAMRFWLATGLAVAFGLCTHYRFFLYPVAALAFLCFFKPEQRQWKNPRLWLAFSIASIGLIPIVWFNLSNQLSSASFYFIDRHPWQFQASGLLHVFKQAGLVTPPLYLLFAYTLYSLYSKSRDNNRGAALLMSFSLLNILIYLVLAPWTDATSTSIHWPLSGYFPLLIFVPNTLRSFQRWLASNWKPVSARILVASIPIIGFAGTLTALVGVGSQAFQEQLQPMLGYGVLSNKMAGWKQFSTHTRSLLNREFDAQTPIILTDNYYTAAQVEFLGLSSLGFTIDNDKAVRDGRIAQYQIWRREESGLASMTGRPLLFISEDSTLTIPDKYDILTRVCHHVDSMEFLEKLVLFGGDKQFSFYKANSVVDTTNQPGYRYSPCPFPARAWIDQPLADQELSGFSNVSGWAYNEDIGVDEIYLLIDGRRSGRTNYGGSRTDVVTAMGVETDPNVPALGFEITFDTATLSNGEHALAIEIINRQGMVQVYGQRTVIINN